MNLNETAQEIQKIAINSGFYQKVADPHFHRLIAFITSEVGELWEAVRKGKSKQEVSEEVADIIILALSISAHLELDIDRAVEDKINKNRQREKLHGKQF